MLKIAPSPTFVASVAIPVPGGDAQLVNFTFNHMGKAALKAWIEAARDREDIDSLASIVAGWDGIDAEFSMENLAALLDAYPSAAIAVLESYVGELGKAAAKN
jgi:hypothetical protein